MRNEKMGNNENGWDEPGSRQGRLSNKTSAGWAQVRILLKECTQTDTRRFERYREKDVL